MATCTYALHLFPHFNRALPFKGQLPASAQTKTGLFAWWAREPKRQIYPPPPPASPACLVPIGALIGVANASGLAKSNAPLIALLPASPPLPGVRALNQQTKTILSFESPVRFSYSMLKCCAVLFYREVLKHCTFQAEAGRARSTKRST
jgi:hypothetical protein